MITHQMDSVHRMTLNHLLWHCGPLKARYGRVIINVFTSVEQNAYPWLSAEQVTLALSLLLGPGCRWPGTPHSLEAVTGDCVHLCNLRALIPTFLPCTRLSPLYLVPGWPLTLTLHHVCSWFQDCPPFCVWTFLCHQTRGQGPGTMAPVWPLCTLISLICLPFW